MQTKRFSEDKPPAGPAPAANGDGSPAGTVFTPSAEEVARKAYFVYVNEGSPDGRDVQHWLDAEAHLIKDRNRTRTHGFHNRT